MSQRHLYGPNYDQLDPPAEWPSLGLDATINEDTFEATINNTELTFIGSAAEYIVNEHIPSLGVFSGVKYRIEITSTESPYQTFVAFNGFIDLGRMEILSESGPIIIKAPVVSFNDTKSVLDRVSVITQGLLRQKGFLNSSHYVNIPVIRESKENIAERTVILSQLAFQTVSFFVKAIQDFFSAISDVVGLSVLIGVIELLTWFINTLIEIQLLKNNILKHKDLFFAPVSYYKGIGIKTPITQAFSYLGYPVDFGIIDEFLSNVYLFPSQDNNDGTLAPLPIGDGTLNRRDFGYLIDELLQAVQLLCNTRMNVINGTVNVKTKTDPSWTATPSLEVKNVKLETTAQYQNGTIRNNTDDVHSVVFVAYQYDPTDGWTLTANDEDSHEVHRSLITDPDPRTNTLKGIKEINIPYAMAVRKQPFDNLWDLFSGINSQFDFWLQVIKDKIAQFQTQIENNIGVTSELSQLLEFSSLGIFLENRTGVLKIQDNSFGIPKIAYMKEVGNYGLRIPSNHKDFIGAKAIYDNYYLPESPADINNFAGQTRDWLNWRIPFGAGDYTLAINNPNFVVGLKTAKFKLISWDENDHSAVTTVEEKKIFDTNITEDEI